MSREFKISKSFLKQILFKIKYPKFLFFFLTVLLAYFLFEKISESQFLLYDLLTLGYLGAFAAGFFYAYSFTAAPATAILLIFSRTENLFFIGAIAGAGALFGDLLIFRFIKRSFQDEIEKMANGKIILKIKLFFLNSRNKWAKLIKKYIIIILGCFVIASPLPDEIGVSLLATQRKLSAKTFYLLSFLLNTAGILIILIVSNQIQL